MKKNDLTLLIAVVTYSALFYNSWVGINFTIFNVIALGLLIWRNPPVIKSHTWCIAAAGSLLSAISVGWHGTALAVVANIVSLAIVGGLSISPESSVIITLILAVVNTLTSPLRMIRDSIIRLSEQSAETKGAKSIAIVVPILIAAIFFYIYRESNPVFDKFASMINLDFISWQWIWFTLGGLILMYALFRFTYFKLDKLEIAIPNNLNPAKFFDQINHSIDENLSGNVLLSLLNILLLIVNALDAYYLYIANELPEGINYSHFLHQGVNALILSIILAISILLYFFRGALNFREDNNAIKVLSYIWIIQNVVLISSTAFRNHLYIEEFSLTHKRIGVYVYLLLSFIGLVYTYIKIRNKKTNWYLFRQNSWAFYIVLIIATWINWDALIVKENILWSQRKAQPTDIKYLSTLSDHTLPYLLQLPDSTLSHTWSGNTTYKQRLNTRAYLFLEIQQRKDFRSWNYDDRITENLLT